MFSLDLEQLDAALSEPKPAAHLAGLLQVLAAHPGPYDWARTRKVPWQSLVIRTRVCNRIHPSTRARLQAGDPDDVRSIHSDFSFAALQEDNSDLVLHLIRLREQALGLPSDFRRGGCHAEAGFTRKVAIFPAPQAIPRSLAVLHDFRAAQPLSHPIWNALLLYLMLLRTHPWSDGNGRTMRLLLAHELWRNDLIHDSVLPLKRVLDANRANEVKLFTEVSRRQRDPVHAARAFADALTLLARIVGLAALHGSSANHSARVPR